MFGCLPKVDSFCFCCSLRVGTIFIALAGIIGLFNVAIPLLIEPIRGNISDWLSLLKIFAYIHIGSTFLLSYLGLIFLYALAMEKEVSGCSTIANLFLIAVVQFLVVQLATMIAVIVAIFSAKDSEKVHSIYSGVLAFPTWIYFMVVVRSYQEEDTETDE